MGNVKKWLSCAEANKRDLVDYLATIGYEPKKIKGNDYWYVSPFRQEHTPSFKVDRKINKWFDHGEGKGGNLVDFGLAYYRCTITELLSRLSGNLNLPIPAKQTQKMAANDGDKHIIITDVQPLKNPALLQYAESRAIPKEIIQKFCSEVSYTNGSKDYFAIGFKNDLGGYELRSKYFKGSSSPKGFTHLSHGHPTLTVFEGFFNFLSFQKLHQNNSTTQTDFLILNSLSFFEKARPVMEAYQQTNLYLDGNTAGQKFTAYATSISPAYRDNSPLYKGHEDLNDFIKNQRVENAPAIKRKPRLRF